MKTAEALFTSLDRRSIRRSRAALPDRYRELLSLPAEGAYSPRGSGLSYAAASFGGGALSVQLTRFDRILAFDPSAMTVDVEAGASLGKLHDFLGPKGLHLPVQPGHPQITVGGCIAFDVHGKNQFREGLFDSCVEDFDLFHPAKGLLRVSRDAAPGLFALTCGGFGLTGIVLRCRLRVRPIPARAVAVENVPTRSLRETCERMEELKDRFDMLYSWNDLGPSGSGAGFVVCGRFDASVSAASAPRRKAFRAGPGRLPSAYNRLSVPLLNAAYRIFHTRLRPRGEMSFDAFTYPVADKAFYFDLFGREGFVERQMLVPAARRWEHLERVEALLARHRPLVVLATLKSFRGEGRLLRYAGEGTSFSLDLAGGGDHAFHRELDELNMSLGVKDNPAKDSRLSGSVMAREYPEYEAFRRELHAYDPARLFRSEMSERLGL